MWVLISIIVGVTLFGLEEIENKHMILKKYDLSVGYGYSTPDISTKEYQIDAPVNEARHSVNTKTGFDINTCSKLPIIPEGESSSIRLGNSNNGSQSEKISYSFYLDTNDLSHSLSYKYALVFHTSKSNTEEHVQPKFNVKVMRNDQLVEISQEVNTYSKHINFNIENQSKDRIIRWTNWTCDYVDLSLFNLNDKITVEFESYDCARGAHFGYAYLVID